MIRKFLRKHRFSMALIALYLIPMQTAISQNSEFGIANNIHAELAGPELLHIKISWTMDRNYSGDFVLGRSEEKISNTGDVLKCKLMGIFNPSQDGLFMDRTVVPGRTYYYVVLTKRGLARNKITLYNNVNVTSSPVKVELPVEMVSRIKTEKSGSSIEIQWEKTKKKYSYGIYRSNSPIYSTEELKASEKIGTTEENEYIDKNVSKFSTYYYAVTSIEKSGKESFTPVKNENYTSKGVFIKSRSSSSPLHVSAFLSASNQIIVKWIKPEIKSENKLSGFEIYRSNGQINSKKQLTESKLIKITGENDTIFTDPVNKPGTYYYAVFPRFKNGFTDINFAGKTSYTLNPIVLGKNYFLTNLYLTYDNNKTVLRWKYSGDFGEKKFRILISKSSKPVLKNILNNSIASVNIEDLAIDLTSYNIDNNYIAMTSEVLDSKTEFISGRNITESPVENKSRAPVKKEWKKKIPDSQIIQKKVKPLPEITGKDDTIQEKKSGYSYSLNTILKHTFYKGRYRIAVNELKRYINSSAPENEKKRALLFIGKCYIELNEYKRALFYLRSSNFKKYHSDEAKFWFNFATMRLK